LLAVQGWSAFSPTFDVIDFVSLYIEIPLMVVMALGWLVIPPLLRRGAGARSRPWWTGDLVDTRTVDLRRDELQDEDDDLAGVEDSRAKRIGGRTGWLWRVWYALV
jgi:AAT family amino acid transporter